MTDILLKADNIYFSYDNDKTQSLNGLSIEIRRGKKIACMGANGSGKSTFFLCCNGILKPSSGTMYWKGAPFDYSRKGLLDLRQKVGIVFQDPDNQLFCASVYQEISFGILNLGISPEQAKEEVEQIMQEMDIASYRHKPTHALSGGQKKLVSIADILVMRPEIVILDEPAAALDPKHTALVNAAVDRMTEEGITVMMATHDVDYAYKWADEVILFKDGKVLLHGTPEEAFSNQTILHETNLEQPAAMKLFDSLCRKGLLKLSLPVPKTLSQLESYISELPLISNYPFTTTSQEVIMNETTLNEPVKKAILVVSFGTSYETTRKKTIDAIEADIASAYPDYQIYRAWTSKMILKKLKERDGIHYDNVCEAFHHMLEDGITHVIVQPTHVINGIENDIMTEEALRFVSQFESIRFGTPLLTSAEDNEAMIEAICHEFSWLTEDDVLVLMGHGTTHFANAIYAALDYTFKDKGFKNFFLGTVEAYPSMDSILRMVKEYAPKRVVLAPFMIVAGDHATNDMAGDDPDSWRCQFEQAGFSTTCVLKGLGEYPDIRKLFIQHVKDAM